MWNKLQRIFEERLIICWAIWNNRNEVAKNNYRSPHRTALFAKEYIAEYYQAQEKIMDRPVKEKERWRLPPMGMVKVNFVGALNTAETIGVIIRDGSRSTIDFCGLGNRWSLKLLQQLKRRNLQQILGVQSYYF